MSAATLEYEEKRSAAAQFFRDLAIDLLESAALDLWRPEPDRLDQGPAAGTRREERRSALQWVAGADARVPFELCCDSMNVPVEALRRALLTNPGRVLVQIREIAASRAQDVGHGEDSEHENGTAEAAGDSVPQAPSARGGLSRP